MNIYYSLADASSLLSAVNDAYDADIEEIFLHRDMIGSVYFARSRDQRYVFKLFRTSDTDHALQSIDVIQYLLLNDYPVVEVIPTATGGSHIVLDLPEGERVGVLQEFIHGTEPTLATDVESIAAQAGLLHTLMMEYPNPLVKRRKEFFIDRFIQLMREHHYYQQRIEDLKNYGDELWDTMEGLPSGFCHGDFHSGNMLKTSSGAFKLFDFDIVSDAYPVIDAAVLCDQTHFFRLEGGAYEETRRMLGRFREGYERHRLLSDAETDAVFSFIAIRHYELIATMADYRLKVEGRHWLSDSYLDQQYDWLMRWRDICGRQ